MTGQSNLTRRPHRQSVFTGLQYQILSLLFVAVVFSTASLWEREAQAQKPPLSKKASAKLKRTKTKVTPKKGSSSSVLPGEHVFDVVGGGSRPGTWGLRLQAGYPWFALQAQLGLKGGWTPLVEIDSALFRRNQFSLGIALRWVDLPQFRITGELLLGWHQQLSDASQQGMTGALRLRVMYRWSRIATFLRIDTRHILLIDRQIINRSSGITSRYVFSHKWSPWASLGIAVRLTERISLDFEFNWPWVDATSISIPGAHLGVHIAIP